MKLIRNILQKISAQEFEEYLTRTINRFPLAVAVLVGLAIVLIGVIGDSNLFSEAFVVKITLLTLFVTWLSIAFQLVLESVEYSNKKRVIGIATIAVLGILYWASFPEHIQYVSFDWFITHIAIHTILGIAALSAHAWGKWFQGRYQDTQWYNFIVNTFVYILQAVVITVLLFALGALLLFTCETLFDITWITGDWYLQWLVFVGVVVGPVYLLSLLPEEEQELIIKETFVHFVVRYVALPFICLYFIILYIYSIQVISNLENWPQGEVAWIVIWFAFFSYVFYFLAHRLSDEIWVERIRKNIPIALLPQVAMLFYSIMLRIDAYGWTVNRYIVVALGVWLVVMSVYHIWKYRSHTHLIVVPTSLTIIMFTILFGPWSMFAVPARSQLNHLESELRSVDILTTDNVVRGLSSAELEALSDKQIASINSIIRYLCEYHGCESLEELLPEQYQAALAHSKRPYSQATVIIEELNLPPHINPSPELMRYLSVHDENYLDYVAVSEFEYMYQFDTRTKQGQEEGDRSHARYDATKGTVELLTPSGEERSIPLREQAQKLLKTRGMNQERVADDSSEPLVITLTYDSQLYTIHISHISGERVGETTSIDFVHGVIFY